MGNNELIITDNPAAAGGGITYVEDINTTTGAQVGTTIAMHGVASGIPEVVGNNVLVITGDPGSTAAGRITYVDDIDIATGGQVGTTPASSTASPPAYRRWSAATS